MRSSGTLFVAAAIGSVTGYPGDKDYSPHDKHGDAQFAEDETCHGKLVVVETTYTTTTVPTTCYVEVTDYVYVNSTVVQEFTENTTLTLHHTVELTDTDYTTETETDTETDTVTETDTDVVTVTTTDTDAVTITTTDTVPATITTYETETLLQTTYERCPKSCSIDAATVTLFFWPTDRPHTYPATYVDDDLDYTFISPSVYMLIPSAKGTNSKGQHVGPSTTQWILGLDLDEVSTIADGPSGSLTRQLELSDLGTDCPQSMDPTAIATLSDSRCAPILAAPTTVSSWAYPCNACGPFGLFDPPYAVPTVTGLIEPTTTEPPPTTSAEPTGTVYVVYHEDGEPRSTETREAAGMDGETTSSVALSVEAPETTEIEEETPIPTPEVTESEVVVEPPVDTPTDGPAVVPTPDNPDDVTASAPKLMGSAAGTSAAIATVVAAIMFSL